MGLVELPRVLELLGPTHHVLEAAQHDVTGAPARQPLQHTAPTQGNLACHAHPEALPSGSRPVPHVLGQGDQSSHGCGVEGLSYKSRTESVYAAPLE